MRWMQFESTRTMHMNAAVQQLVRFNARRRDRGITGRSGVGVRVRRRKRVGSAATEDYRSGVRESPSLARNMTSIIPPSRGNDQIGM